MDTMNIKFTRNQRVILWNLIGDEYDRIVENNDKLDSYLLDRLKALKELEILIVGQGMYQFTVNGKVFKFKTLKEARFMAQFNDGITIIAKVKK